MHVALRTLTFLVALALALPAVPQTDDEPYNPITAKDPEIPVDQLRILVTPLRKDELAVEADAWVTLIQAKVKQISNAEIAVKFKNQQIQAVKETAKAAEQAQEAAVKAEKAATTDPEAAEEAAKAKEEAEKKAAEAAEKAAATAEQATENEEIQAAAREAEDEAKQQKAAREAEKAAEAGTAAPTPPAPSGESAAAKVAATDPTNADALADTAKQAAEEEADAKTALLDRLNTLRDERTALIDRAEVVLNEWNKKGGDPEEYETYLAAVSGIRMESDDLQSLWATLVGWLTSPQGGIRWGLNLVQFVGTILAFYIAARISGKATSRAMKYTKGTSSLMRDFVATSVRRVVFALGFIVGLAALEINIGPVLAVIGAAGFVIAFALQETLGNFASGIMILVYRPFDVGDVVDAGGVSGTVQALNLVSTTIKTFDNKVMIVPNNSIWNNVITNATGAPTRRVDLVFGISYTDDVDKAADVLESVVKEHPLTLDDPAPTIRVHELGDSSVNFICRPWVKTADYWTVYWDLQRDVKKRFDAEGISIPFPQRDIHVHHADLLAQPERDTAGA